MEQIKVYVSTAHIGSSIEPEVVVIDHSNFEMRKWLNRHMFWSVRNKRCVVVSPAPEAAVITKELPDAR